jgi:hypothetical protein
MTNQVDIRIQYHSPDQAWAAVLLRDGEPWFLDGALVGMGVEPSSAVQDLIGIVIHLIVYGENFLTAGLLTNLDRQWLQQAFAPLGEPADWLARQVPRR